MKTHKSIITGVLAALSAIAVLALLLAGCGSSGGSAVILPGTPDTPGTQNTMLITTSWGDDTLRITDNVGALVNGDTATPRIINGPDTGISYPSNDSVAVDSITNSIYVTDQSTGDVIVFDAMTAVGNITPARTIDVSANGAVALSGVDIDESRDRLYLVGTDSDGASLFIYNSASTLDGTLTPDEKVAIAGQTVTCDSVNDRIYIGDYSSGAPMSVYDNASTLASGASPDRSVTLSSGKVYDTNIDPVNDRLYVASRTTTAGGNNVLVFDNASTLDGTIDPDNDSVARFTYPQAMKVVVDNKDRLYVTKDSPKDVLIYSGASTMTGDVTDTPLIIAGMINCGYGMDYLAY